MADAPAPTPPPLRPRWTGLLWATAPLALAGIVVASTSPVWRTTPPAPAPPRLGRLPAFSLLDGAGREVNLERLRGRPWVANFIFTRCGGVCPGMTARMARLRREVPDDVTFVSFTVDPANDTGPVLARYAQQFGADARWLFVTGPREELYRLSIGGFKLAAEEVSIDQQQAGGDGPFLHSSKFVLVDAAGDVRGYYDSNDEAAVSTLRADLERVRVTG